jgi:1,4-alpha-glucan branching enzyme
MASFSSSESSLHSDYNIRFNVHTSQAYVSLKHDTDRMVVFERGGLLFIFNFHATQSYTDYRVGAQEAGEYKVILSSDEKRFGGFDNVDVNTTYFTTPLEWNNRSNWLQVRLFMDLLT